MGRRPRSQPQQTGGSERAAPLPGTPAAIRLTAPHGFIEDVHNKGVFHWEAGEVVTSPVTVALLIERRASWEPVKCSGIPASPPHH